MNSREPRVAIVTGGGRGIGGAIAQRLGHEGWRVAVADRDAAAAQAAAAAAGGIGVTCDVGEEAQVIALVDRVRSEHGHIDAVVSNAGISANGPLESTSLADWNRVLAVNLTALFLLARAAAPDLRRSRGAILAIASTRAHMSEPGTLAYSASKGGIVALVHALPMTLAPEVRVNCISPGWIDTGTHGPLTASDHAQHPVGRVGRPADIAAAASYLLSPEAGFATGTELVLDGGMTRKMIYV